MKNSSIILVLIVIFIIFSSENGKMVAEAKKCHDAWRTADDEAKCKKECMAKYKGVGTIQVIAFPPEAVLVLCNCEFDC
ncbi:putative defensin-like protein [Cardamine amara subsp. amara]|uniref:Defensin-like protein n=1 Tax=Cardamine amara subsp. amara TaxID=228776 RepID=A0ABD1BZM7_CARAN